MSIEINNRFSLAGLLLLTVVLLTSFNQGDETKIPIITYRLTVQSDNDSVKLFDLLIKGKKDNDEAFYVREKSLKTPYELKLENGTYAIVIHGPSEGKVIGKVEMLTDGKVSATARANDKLILLTVDKDKTLGATGM